MFPGQVEGKLLPNSEDGKSQLLRGWEVDRLKSLIHCLELVKMDCLEWEETLVLYRLHRFVYGLWLDQGVVGHRGEKGVGIHFGDYSAGETLGPGH